ncbi:MAG: hypothetical protein AB1733_12935 [Thermodesulfobacteriota bacterium]
MKVTAELHYRVGRESGTAQALMGNLDPYDDHMWAEGSLAFNCNECHAYSMRGSINGARSDVAMKMILGGLVGAGVGFGLYLLSSTTSGPG